MKKSAHIILHLLLIFSITACSTQYRNADAGLTEAQLNDFLGVAEQGAGSGLFSDLVTREDKYLYFADAPGPLGYPQNVASFYDLQFLGLPAEVSPYDLKRVHVFFLISDDGKQAALSIQIWYQSEDENNPDISRKFESLEPPIWGDEDFVAVLTDTNSSNEIAIRSYDLDDSFENTLAGVIQLRVSLFDSNGREVENGQISTLVNL